MITTKHLRWVRRLLLLTQWSFGACAGWILITAAFLSAPLPQPTTVKAASPADATGSSEAVVALDDLAGIWTRDLRQTLIEPVIEPQPKPKEAPAPPPMNLPKLLATFVEGRMAWALFNDTNGSQRVRPAGGNIDSFDIVTISPGTAKLRRGKQTYEVRVPKKEQPLRQRRRQG